MAAEEEGAPVDLYVYDLTHGLAALLSPAILGRQVEGVWHTAVVVFGREYYYGGGGIAHCAPGSTQLGAPQQVLRLGSTFVPRAVFADYLRGLAATTYTGAAYQLLEHNCNHFSEEAAQFLCGGRVPQHILAQPERDLPPPLRAALAALLQSALPAPAPAPAAADHAAYTNGERAPRAPRGAREDSPDYLTLNNQIEEARWRALLAGAGALWRELRRRAPPPSPPSPPPPGPF